MKYKKVSIGRLAFEIIWRVIVISIPLFIVMSDVDRIVKLLIPEHYYWYGGIKAVLLYGVFALGYFVVIGYVFGGFKYTR